MKFAKCIVKLILPANYHDVVTRNKVSDQRQKKGLTQEELASLTNVIVRTIQRMESGESRSRASTLRAIAAALEIPFETLLAKDEVQSGLPASIPPQQNFEEAQSAKYKLKKHHNYSSFYLD